MASKSFASRLLRQIQAKKDGEADLIGSLAHDLEGDRGGAGDALASVAGIGEDALDEGE